MIKYIVPITCYIVNQCKGVEGENTVFEYNHLKFNQVCLVGLIRNVIKRANDVTYLIDDMTSRELVSVKLQADEPDDMETEEVKAPQMFIENQYVRVFGIIKSLQGQKIVQAFKILPVKDLNEITHHILDVMNSSIHYYAKANGEQFGETSVNAGGSFGHTAAAKSGSNHGDASFGGLSGFQFNLIKYIKASNSSSGVAFNSICQNFPNIPKDKIRETLDFLSNEGQVYTTIDDEHFQSTDAMDN